MSRLSAFALFVVGAAWAGADDRQEGNFPDRRALLLAEEKANGGVVPRMFKIEPIGFRGPATAGLQGLHLLWDSGFSFGPSYARWNQCATVFCGNNNEGRAQPLNDPRALVADDFFLPEGTVVRGIKIEVYFRQPAVSADLDGVRVVFWDNDPTAIEGRDFPANSPQVVGENAFVVKPGDPGWSVYELGPTNRRLEVTFNPGDRWVSPGGKYWVSIVPARNEAPATYVGMMSEDWVLFEPAVQAIDIADPLKPWAREPPDSPHAEYTGLEMMFQLWGHVAPGGSTVVTISGGPAACDCEIRLRITQQPVTSCEPESCPIDPELGSRCGVTVLARAGTTASQLADNLADMFRATAACGSYYSDVEITMAAYGPRLVVTSDRGARPIVCIDTTACESPPPP